MAEMLNDADITAQLESEIQALNGGINPVESKSQEDYEDNSDEFEYNQEDDTQDYEDNQEEGKEENKTEKKIKKLLHQRNEERKEKESLNERLTRLENELADTNFYKENQDAIKYKDEILDLVNKRGLTRDEAYLLIAGKQIIEQNKKISSNKTSMLGNTPGININGNDPKDMAMKDLDNLVKNMYSAGKITI